MDAIRRVVEARQAGWSLDAAIAHVGFGHRPDSLYAAVHEQWPALAPRVVNRRTMLAISRAIEDECCARAADPLLVAAFQTATAYATARARWHELARTASATVVLAAFPRTTRRRDGPVEVAIGPRSPLLREWAVVCVAPRSSACLVGWEHPDRRRRRSRAFEAVWSVDAAVVQTAARAALMIAADHASRSDLPITHPALARPAEPIDPDRLVALTDRIVTNLDDALERRP